MTPRQRAEAIANIACAVALILFALGLLIGWFS